MARFCLSYETQRNMVSGTNNKWGSASRANVTHGRDKLGRITHLSRWGTMYNVYETGGLDQSFQYSSRGELVHTQTDLMGDYGTLPGRTINLSYDGQGNRKQLKIDGMVSHTYTPGPANEYTQVDYGAHAGGISGTSSQPGNVLVGNDLAERRYGYFYRGFLPSENARWTFEDIFAAKPPPSGGGYVTAYRAAQKELYLPSASVVPVYDEAGNLKEDGWWVYEYDGENRLIKMESVAPHPSNSRIRRLEFKYDYLGRRVRKIVRSLTSGGSIYQTHSDTGFAYWDWHLIGEVNLLGNKMLRHYAWGLDKEGVRPGAGGVGGLLMVTHHAQDEYDVNKTFLAMNDYIGNVIGLLDPDTGNTVAEYVPSEARSCRRSPTAYDPFGRTIRATGTYADKNPIRFSSQYTDNETGLVYFGFRYYHPQWGRFINRDPIEEEGGENLYRFVSNDPVNEWDHLGLFAWGLAAKVVKVAIKGGDIGMTLKGIVDDAKTIMDPNATAGQRAMAAASLASEIVSPVSMRDAKAGINVVQGLRSGDKAAEKLTGKGDVVKDATKNRVKLRKQTRQEIESNQPRNEQGEMVDPNSGEPLKPGEVDVGHKPGQEWRKRKEMHEDNGSTRKEVVDAENDSDLYQLEDRSSNRSHKHEEP